MRLDVALDGVLQLGDGFEDAAADFSSRDGREESCPTRMIGQPCYDVGMFVRGVIVGNGMDDFAGGDGAFHGDESGYRRGGLPQHRPSSKSSPKSLAPQEALSRRFGLAVPLAVRVKKISYRGYRFPPEIIQQAIWLYLRFTSLRDVEDLLAERGIMVSYYETVRRWVNHFGPMIAAVSAQT